MTHLAVQSARPPAGSLPAEVTCFVGRRREISEVKQLLSESRLVTLNGPGGVGKTRLALRVAADVRRVYRDGAWLVELADLRDPGLLARTVADELGIRNPPVGSAAPLVVEYLRGRELLLLLDNCEHLVEACAMLVGTLLRECPDLRVLATSRQSLGAAGESIFPVLPFPVSDLPESSSFSQSDAVQLFVERARRVLPGFSVDTDGSVTIARLCRRLEGIPLAIELAVAWLRTLSLEQIEARLDERYRLLMLGPRNAPARQQTLRGLMDWSHGLCSPAERSLWARLSVFAGGMDLDATEYVCGGDGLEPEEVLHLLDSLVDKSVVMREHHQGGARYRMLETIREYGQELLAETKDERRVRRRHRDWYERLAAHFSDDWMGPRQAEWVGRWTREHPNVRAALEFCAAEPGEAANGLRLAVALDEYWAIRGRFGEARHWFDRLLPASPEPTRDRFFALRLAGAYAVWQGDLESAQRLLTEADTLAERFADETAVADTMHVQAAAAMLVGDLDEAVALFGDALARMRGAHGSRQQLNTQLFLGATLIFIGENGKGSALLEDCIAQLSRRGEVWWRGWALTFVAYLEIQRNRLEHAQEAGRQAVRCHRALGPSPGLAGAIEALASVADLQGDHDRAAVLFGVADALWRAIGASPESTIALIPRLRLRQEHMARARTALGDVAYEQTWRQGSDLPLDVAVDYVLEDETPTAAAPTPDYAETKTPLTRREREVAELVAQGLTNKDIAARLVISRRTAETHVEHILTKLGFTSRGRIATWMAEQKTNPP